MDDNNTLNNTHVLNQYSSQQYSSEDEHFNKLCGKDIKLHIPLFAGIGVEKLFYFYTHVLYKLDFHYLSNEDYNIIIKDGEVYDMYAQIWKDMLMMVEDPVFVRKLRKLKNFTKHDFQKVYNKCGGAPISILARETEFGLDRKQLLYFLVDIAVNSLQQPTKDNSYEVFRSYYTVPLTKVLLEQIFAGKWPVEDRLHALKTVFTRKVKIPNTNINGNIGKDSFLYELNFEKLQEYNNIARNDERFKEEVMNKLEPILMKEKEIQTEEPIIIITLDEETQTD